jgi:integrase
MARKIRGKNEGSLHQRPNGTWRAQFSVSGKRISKSFKTKAECQAWLRQMQDQIDHGFDYHASKTSLGDYLLQWLEIVRPTLRLKTSHQYGQIIQKHILPNIGGMALKDLALARIEQFYGERSSAGIGTRTVRIIHNILHKSLEKAVRYGLLTQNPSHGAALPRVTPTEMNVLDEAQVGRFLVAAQGSYYEALYYLAVTTGMRQAEMFGLKWIDLQWNSGTLHVQRQAQRVNGHGWAFVEPKTKSGRRTIKLGEGTLQVLRLHRQRLEQLKSLAGDRWQENDLIFPSRAGTPGDPSNLRVDFLKVLDRAGLPKIRFHDLRHTAASLMLNHGVPVLVASKRLGHSKPSVTLDIYGHLYHEMQDEAARIIDELVTPIQVSLPHRVEQMQVDQQTSAAPIALNCTTTAPLT